MSLFVFTVGVRLCNQCLQVMCEQIILFNGWCMFILSMCLGHIWTDFFYLLLVYVHFINVFRSCINILIVFTVGVRLCKNRLFLLIVDVLSCYHCYQVMYEQVHVICIQFDSWCKFMLSMFSGSVYVWTGYSYWQLVYVHVINVFRSCMNR